MVKFPKKFLLSEYNSIYDDCRNKEKKYKTSIDALKRIAYLYNEEFKDELDMVYITTIYDDVLLLQAYLIYFFCNHSKNIKKLYNIINKDKAKLFSIENFEKEDYYAIANACKTKPFKINLNVQDLLRIASYYDKYFPYELNIDELNKKDKFDKISYLSNFFCLNIKNIKKLYYIINEIDLKDIIEEEKETKKEEPKKDKPKKDEPKKEEPKKEEPMKDKPKKDEPKKKEIKVEIKQADEPYKEDLKKEINDSGINEYTIKKLEKDIESDNFIKEVIESNIKSLQFKLINYKKLVELNLDTDISKIINLINDKIKFLKTTSNIIQIKRKELLSIINDENNGILSIKGKSREKIRNILIRLIYVYIYAPDMFFNSYNNFILLGHLGTGRTKLAKVISHLMYNLGLLLTSNFIFGKSINKSYNLFINSIEGVLFLNEPSNLKDTNENLEDFINYIDIFKGCLLIIISGNKDKITNAINDKFNEKIELLDYDSNDMYIIFEELIDKTVDYKKWFTEEQQDLIKNLIIALGNKKVFKNQANDISNLVNLIIENAILYGDKYNTKLIITTFKIFLLNKGNIAFQIQQ